MPAVMSSGDGLHGFGSGMSRALLKFEAAALHWSCYTTGDETEVQASQ